MKTRTILIISALLAAALSSCGSAAQYANDASRQKYQDGIYYTENAAAEAAVSEEETDLLVRKTKGSPIFLKNGEKTDTLFIPEGKKAVIGFDGRENTTNVTVFDDPPGNRMKHGT